MLIKIDQKYYQELYKLIQEYPELYPKFLNNNVYIDTENTHLHDAIKSVWLGNIRMQYIFLNNKALLQINTKTDRVYLEGTYARH